MKPSKDREYTIEELIKDYQRKALIWTSKVVIGIIILGLILATIPGIASRLLDTDGPIYGFIIHSFLLAFTGYLYVAFRTFYLDEGIVEMARITGMPMKKWIEDIRKTDHLSLYINSEMSKEKPNVSDLDNMKVLKQKIIEYCRYIGGDEMENLKLLKAYYTSAISNNNKPIMISIFGFAFLMLTFISQQTLIGDGIEVFETELSFLYVTGIGLAFVVSMYTLDLGEKKRVALIYHTIDEIIKEREA